MVVAKKFVVKQSFDGEPKRSDFLLVEEELPLLKENEFLTEAAYLSMDPYQRIKIGNKFPCDMIGGQVAKVIESSNAEYPVGKWVMGHFGWRTRTVVTPESEKKCEQKPFIYLLPDFGDLPISLALGVCGRVGNTAYFGFTEICKPEPGHTVVVSGAAGAVGSHVGQIAKIYGCKVIGFAGTDEKCAWLKSIGFDAAGNYKTIAIEKFLKENAPNGIDSYFDNVGGEISRIVMSQMKDHGRVAVCGAISKYNNSNQESIKTLLSLNNITDKDLVVTPFLVNQFAERTLEGIKKNLQWVKEGKLKYKEHITEGFVNAPDAFIGMFRGENTGKALVKV